MNPIVRPTLALAVLLAAAACVPQGPNTAAGPGYQAPVSRLAPPANVRAICFDEIAEGDHRRLVRYIFECQRAERRRGLERSDGRGR